MLFRLVTLFNAFAARTSWARCARLLLVGLASLALLLSFASTAGAHGTARTASTAAQVSLRSLYDTGQYSKAKPVLGFCNGATYLGWASTESTARLNIAIGTSPSHFTSVVTFNEYLYRDVSLTRSTGPSLACWNGHLYLAFTGTNNYIYVGYFDGNAAHNYLNGKNQLSQASYRSPALAPSNDGRLNLAWTGADNRLNVIRTSTGTTWGATYTWSQKATGGPGFAYFCYSGCNLYLSWVGTDAAHQLNIGYFRISDGGFVFLQSLGNNYQITSATGFDASLAVSGSSILYMGYELGGGVVNGAKASNSNPSGSWTHSLNLLTDTGAYGVGAATDPSSGKVYFTFTSTSPSNQAEIVERAASDFGI